MIVQSRQYALNYLRSNDALTPLNTWCQYEAEIMFTCTVLPLMWKPLTCFRQLDKFVNIHLLKKRHPKVLFARHFTHSLRSKDGLWGTRFLHVIYVSRCGSFTGKSAKKHFNSITCYPGTEHDTKRFGTI